MPPADQSAPTPAPVPETPKPEKVGFFAKLFGKKPKEEAVPAGHESQTPPAQLSEPGAPDATAPVDPLGAATVIVPETPVSAEMPSMPESSPVVEEENTQPTLDVPPSLSVDPPKVDEGMGVPPVQNSAPSENPEDPTNSSGPKL